MKAQKVTFRPEPDDFYAKLRERVDAYFAEHNKGKYGNAYFFAKAFLLIGTYVGLYFTALSTKTENIAMLAMVLMGPLAILIGINVAHDAAHGNVSKHAWINKSFLHLFDLLGTNSYMWRKRHVFSHHAYPNILNKDADLKQNPMVRIFPGDEVLRMHKFQFIYAPFLYLLYTINWLYFRDFQDFFAKQIGSLEISGHRKTEIVKLICFKLLYIGYMIVMPMMFSVLSWQMVLLSVVLMNFAGSLLITLALIPSHVAENSLFLLPDENGVMPNSWSHHQVLSVIDFATGNWFLNFLFGGFNHHISHHLFPNINHIHVTNITPIIKRTAEEFGLPYNHEESFFNAYLSHFKLLKNNGVKLSEMEV